MGNYSISTPTSHVAELQRTFDGIPDDPYLEGGYRGRTQSRFERRDGVITRMDPVDLYQSSEVNKLENYGGIQRTYPELPAGIENSQAFIELIEEWFSGFDLGDATFSVHQIRTRSGGDPVPEGAHRDGYQFVGIYVVARENIPDDSGLSTVWDASGQVVFEDRLLAEGELLSFDDREFVHDVTPVADALAEGPG